MGFNHEITGQNWAVVALWLPISPLEYNVTVNPGDFDPSHCK